MNTRSADRSDTPGEVGVSPAVHVSSLGGTSRRVLIATIIGLLGAFAGVTSIHAALQSLNLDEAVELALRNNSSLRAQALEVSVSEAAIITARLRPNPVIYNETQDFTLGVQQLLERGHKRRLRTESAELGAKVATASLEDAKRSLVLSVRTGFIAALLAESNLGLAQANLDSFRRIESLQSVRLAQGEISRADFARIGLQKLQFESDMADAILARSLARANLRQLLSESDLATDFEVEGDLRLPEFDTPVADLLERASLLRPDLRSAETAVAKAQTEAGLAVANATSDPTVTVGWGHQGSAIAPSAPWFRPLYSLGPRDNWVGFGISVPLRVFDRNQGEIARSKAETERARWTLDAIRRQVERDVEEAYAAWKASRDRVLLFERTYLSRSHEAQQAAEFAFEKGATSVLDLLDAERTDRSVQLAYHQALADCNTHLFELTAAVGDDLKSAR